MAKGKKITKEIFERIKIMLKAGVKPNKIMALEAVGEETIRRVNLAETYEQYQENSRKEHIKYAERLMQNRQIENQEQMIISETNKDELINELSLKLQDVCDLVIKIMKGELK